MVARVPSEQRRRDLVGVALHQYVSLGPEATTRTSLAAELGVDRVIVHRLYPDLQALFADVIDHVRSVGFTQIEAAASSVDDLSNPTDVWTVLIDQIVRAARAHPLEWQLLFLTPPNPEVAAQLAALRADVAERAIAELIARADEPTNDDERRELSWGTTFLYQGLLGVIAEHLAHDDAGDDEQFVRFLASMLDVLVPLPASFRLDAH